MKRLIARIADREEVDRGFVEINSGTASDADLLGAIATNHGGVPEDYDLYELNQADEGRVNNGDEYLPLWTGTDLTGLDFSAEDAKGWLEFSADRTEVAITDPNGVTLGIKVYLPDGVTLDTSINEEFRVPVITSIREMKARVQVLEGQGSRKILSEDPGCVEVGGSCRYEGYRNKNYIKVEFDY